MKKKFILLDTFIDKHKQYSSLFFMFIYIHSIGSILIILDTLESVQDYKVTKRDHDNSEMQAPAHRQSEKSSEMCEYF